MIKRIAGLGFKLALVCAVAAFGLSYTYCLTRERIAYQIWISQIMAAREVMPEVRENEDFEEQIEMAEEVRKKVPGLDKIFAGYRDGKLVGYAVQTLPRGYGGPVKLMVGIKDGVTTEISVVEHKETPGLGSNIEDPKWNRQFRNRKLNDPLKINKDIDSISGATISSKAVARGVKSALEANEFFSEWKQ